VKKIAMIGVLCAACGTFESEQVVIDLRFLAAQADVPDQVIDVDLSGGVDGIDPVALIEQVEPITMCYLVADPAEDRRLRWRMSMCADSADKYCNSGVPEVELGGGVIDDPDTTPNGAYPCVTVQPDGNLLGVARSVIETDSLALLAGIEIAVTIDIGGTDAPADEFIHGSKLFKLTPRIPMGRTGNLNPTLDGLDVTVTLPDAMEPGPAMRLPLGRCVDQVAPIEVAPRSKLRLTPVEAPGMRETYVIPSLEDLTKSQVFVEAPTYQFFTTNGSFSPAETGGKRDISGNPAPIFTDYRVPVNVYGTNVPLEVPTDVPIWIIARDERLGTTWYESCVRVVP